MDVDSALDEIASRHVLDAYRRIRTIPPVAVYDGPISVHRLDPGTKLYHGTTHDLRQSALRGPLFLSPFLGVSKMHMVSSAGRGFTIPYRSHTIYLYTFEVTAPMYIIYNQNIPDKCHVATGRSYECGPFDPTESMDNFCARYGGHGFYQMRDATCIPSLYDASLKVRQATQTKISKMSAARFAASIAASSHNNGELTCFQHVLTPEIVLCDPARAPMNLVNADITSGEALLVQLRRHTGTMNLRQSREDFYYNYLLNW